MVSDPLRLRTLLRSKYRYRQILALTILCPNLPRYTV